MKERHKYKMKKIIAIILALTCVFAMFSCKEKNTIENALKEVEKMYVSSAPTKIVTKTSNVVGNTTYDGEYVLTTGKIGDKLATTYTYWYEELRPISDGSSSQVIGPKVKIEGSKEYLEEYGLRVNGGEWDASGFNFAPAAGDIAITLDVKYLVEPKYENNTLTFSVKPQYAEEVLGVVIGYELDEEAITENISVVIKDAGSLISSVDITYTVDGGEEYPDTVVKVSAVYTYDLEKISISK